MSGYWLALTMVIGVRDDEESKSGDVAAAARISGSNEARASDVEAATVAGAASAADDDAKAKKVDTENSGGEEIICAYYDRINLPLL